MIISSIELREIRLPLIHFFETSFGRTTERCIIIVKVIDSAESWGECTAGKGPFYSDEGGNGLAYAERLSRADGCRKEVTGAAKRA